MAQNLKPVIDELKNKWKNREEVRDQVVENLKTTRDTVEKTIKVVASQAKDSKLVHDYVIPMVESEQAEQAMKFLNSKLGTHPFLTKLESARQAIIDLKVAQAKPAAEAPAEAASTTAVQAETEEPKSETVTKEPKEKRKKPPQA